MPSDPYRDELPRLIDESVASIRARMDADLNQGLTPDDPRWQDDRQGSPYQMYTQPFVNEMSRLYDQMNMVVAASLIVFAWGEYLDHHGRLLKIERGAAEAASGQVTFTGTNGTVVPVGFEVSPPTVEEGTTPRFLTTASGTISGGTVTLPVIAVDAGSSGNLAAGALTSFAPFTGITSVTNAAPITNGQDVESDEDYRTRLLRRLYQGAGAGNIAWYEQTALAWPGVDEVEVVPGWTTANSVLVIIRNAGQAVSNEVITGLQNHFDPAPGDALGVAPPAAEVTVTTTTDTAVNITAAVTFHPGYSLDGTGDTTPRRAALVAELSDYLRSIPARTTLIRNALEARFFRVEGVKNVNLTAPAADVVVDPDDIPPVALKAGTITLT